MLGPPLVEPGLTVRYEVEKGVRATSTRHWQICAKFKSYSILQILQINYKYLNIATQFYKSLNCIRTSTCRHWQMILPASVMNMLFWDTCKIEYGYTLGCSETPLQYTYTHLGRIYEHSLQPDNAIYNANCATMPNVWPFPPINYFSMSRPNKCKIGIACLHKRHCSNKAMRPFFDEWWWWRWWWLTQPSLIRTWWWWLWLKQWSLMRTWWWWRWWWLTGWLL